MNVLLWPLIALWRLLSTIVALTGRLLALIIGVVFLIVGFVLTVTVVGAVVGIPLIALGLLFIIRGLFSSRRALRLPPVVAETWMQRRGA